MAKGPASGEISRGDIRLESSGGKPKSEHKPKAADNLGPLGAMNALGNKGDEGNSRARMVNLAQAGRKRTYRRFETMAQYKEAKFGNRNLKKTGIGRTEDEKPAQGRDESRKIYQESYMDPQVRKIEVRVATRTNLEPGVMEARERASQNYQQVWHQEYEAQNRREWDQFVRENPKKAEAYSGNHKYIREALERFRDEQTRAASLREAQAAEQAENRQQIQAESNEALADSVRREANDKSLSSDEVGQPVEPEGSEGEKAKTFRDTYSEAGDHVYYKKDKWRGKSGQIILNGDNLSFTPARETHGAFNRDTTWMGIYTQSHYDRDTNSWGRYRIVVEEANNFERGIELAVDVTDSESWDPAVMESSGMEKVPTPFMWELLETNPESVGKGGHTFEADAYGAKALNGKKYIPGVDSFYGIGGRAPELVGETTVGVVWGRVNVDRETLIHMQSQAIEYIEKQVQEGKMPQEMLDTAKGLIDSHKAPDKIKRALANDRGRGKSKENPKLYVSFLQGSETWKQKGQVRTEGNLIVYDDDKQRKHGERREVEMTTTSIDTSGVIKEVLTKQSWDILKVVPEEPNAGVSQSSITEATTNSLLDRKGEWKKFVKPFRTDGATLSRMQQMIRGYVESNVQQGKMDASVLVQVDSLLKFKQSTITPIRFGDKVVYELKGRKAKAVEVREVKREPRTLVEKIAEGGRNGEPVSSVTITDADVRKYLMTKELPMASITQLDIRFQGQTVTLSGEIKAGFGFIKGKLDFRLGIANKADGSGLRVTGQSFNTESNMIRSRLGDVESQLNNINSFIGDDINDQLQRTNPNLRLLGLTISPEGTFIAKVQNSRASSSPAKAA